MTGCHQTRDSRRVQLEQNSSIIASLRHVARLPRSLRYMSV